MRNLIFSILFTFFGLAVFSQNTTEFGYSAGYSYYLGDLNTTAQFSTEMTHFTWGFMLRQPINDRWAWKNNLLFGKLSGSDALSSSAIQQNRNLSFETDLVEFASTFEFNFFKYHSFVIDQHFTPYLYTGLGLFWINPTTEMNGNQYELWNYQTENRAKAPSKTQFSIPFGFGLKFKFSHRFMFSMEWGLRKTFTDYIDDVSTSYPDNPTEISTVSQELSNRAINTENRQNEWGMQRGNSQRKDLYSTAQLTLLIRIGKNPNLCRYNTH